MIEEEDGEEEDDKTEEDCNLWEENAINERRNTGMSNAWTAQEIKHCIKSYT